MKVRLALAFAAALLALAAGCRSSPPKIRHYEAQDFDRPANLVDIAVLDSGVAPGAEKKEYLKGAIVDFATPAGRVIRVESTARGVSSRVFVSHSGPGGVEGAKEALKAITQWMEETDAFRERLPDKPASSLDIPRP